MTLQNVDRLNVGKGTQDFPVFFFLMKYSWHTISVSGVPHRDLMVTHITNWSPQA